MYVNEAKENLRARLRLVLLRAKGYPVKIRTCGGKYAFSFNGAVYLNLNSLPEAVAVALYVVEESYKWHMSHR